MPNNPAIYGAALRGVRSDWYSRAAVRLRLLFQDQELACATCFFWKREGQLYLVTNWHVVTGRNPTTVLPIETTNGGLPDAVCFEVRRLDGTTFSATIPLYDGCDRPLWLVHPEHGRGVDVVALPISGLPDGATRVINQLPEIQFVTQVGMSLFIVGFPFDTEHLPIWKRATIASEPDYALLPGARYMLVDSLSRPGMSGAPVIQREYGRALVETEPFDSSDPSSPLRVEWQDVGIGSCSKFIGVYSGRLHTNSSLDAQLGMVWRRHLLEEVIGGDLRDRHPLDQLRTRAD